MHICKRITTTWASERLFMEMQCETADYAPYEKTQCFYENVGFEPLITLTEMWDEDNPCLIIIKSLALQSLATGMNQAIIRNVAGKLQ